MPNTNCLEGMQCQKCGSEGPFDIVGVSWFEVSDDGASSFGDIDWDNDSACSCKECSYMGIVSDFKE